jgi:hypothetical protein
MSDTVPGAKHFRDEVGQTVGEIAKDVKDEVGRVLEHAVQSVASTQPTLQQIQQKQLEDQQKLSEVRGKIKWYKDIEKAQKRVRDEQKQEEMRKIQSAQTEKQEKEFKLIKKEEGKKILVPTPVSNIENKSKIAA